MRKRKRHFNGTLNNTCEWFRDCKGWQLQRFNCIHTFIKKILYCKQHNNMTSIELFAKSKRFPTKLSSKPSVNSEACNAPWNYLCLTHYCLFGLGCWGRYKLNPIQPITCSPARAYVHMDDREIPPIWWTCKSIYNKQPGQKYVEFNCTPTLLKTCRLFLFHFTN